MNFVNLSLGGRRMAQMRHSEEDILRLHHEIEVYLEP